MAVITKHLLPLKAKKQNAYFSSEMLKVRFKTELEMVNVSLFVARRCLTDVADHLFGLNKTLRCSD